MAQEIGRYFTGKTTDKRFIADGIAEYYKHVFGDCVLSDTALQYAGHDNENIFVQYGQAVIAGVLYTLKDNGTGLLALPFEKNTYPLDTRQDRVVLQTTYDAAGEPGTRIILKKGEQNRLHEIDEEGNFLTSVGPLPELVQNDSVYEMPILRFSVDINSADPFQMVDERSIQSVPLTDAIRDIDGGGDAQEILDAAIAATAAAKTATSSANSAASSATTAATSAGNAANTANTAATNATNATNAANTATTNANNATTNANDAAASAGTATNNANAAATNANNAAQEARDAAQQAMPTGSINAYAGAAAPSGWLLCQGQAISRTTYATLFAAIGSAYGAGNGSTTFNLPDLRGRVPVGYNSGESEFNTTGGKGGSKTHTLTEAQLPQLTGNIGIHATSNGASSLASGDGVFASSRVTQGKYVPMGPEANASLSIDRITFSAGSNQPHNNMPPYITLNYIIKT